VEDCHTLSVSGRFEWSPARYDEGFWCEWYRDEDGLVALHTIRDGREWTQRIRLTFTPCNFGGSRPWFLCPNCGRRIGKLYFPAVGGNPVWLCRHCYGLTYEQRRAGCDSEYLSWRADRLLDRHGITRITQEGEDYLQKPKGMRYASFQRVVDKRNVLIDRANLLFLSSFYSRIPHKFRRGLSRSGSLCGGSKV
jgi:hypothetical protein